MNATNRFIFHHWLKLGWKFIKHGLGVFIMIDKREGSGSAPKGRFSKNDNVFMHYLDLED